jgi:hypothetical protein
MPDIIFKSQKEAMEWMNGRYATIIIKGEECVIDMKHNKVITKDDLREKLKNVKVNITNN